MNTISGETLTKINLASEEQLSDGLEPELYYLVYAIGVNKLYVGGREEPTIWVIDPGIDLGKGVAH